MTQALGLDGLSRSTLLSLIAISTALVLFATGATFAVLATDSASGTVTAGSLAITLDVFGTGAAGELQFIPGEVTCPDSLLPGDACLANVTVKNTGNLPLSLAAPIPSVLITDSVVPDGCSPADWPVTIGIPAGPPPATLAPNATWLFSVIVSLSPSNPLACQQEQATVSVAVDGTF